MKFDLDSLDGGEIASATLRLYVSQLARAGDFSVSEVQSSWDEGNLTYASMPAVNSIPEAISAVDQADIGTYVELDITALATRWLSGSVNNDGISLQRNGPFQASFASSESSFEPELVLDLRTADKPNFATVKKEGGDYSDPIAAMNDRDKWCDVPSRSKPGSCQLLIGPGTFFLAEPLNLRDKFDVLGAGNSGSQRTELVAQSGVEAVIQLLETSSGEQGNVISDLIVRNSGGGNGNVRGIWSLSHDEDGTSATIRNVSVQISGSVADATTGIGLGRTELRNVDVSVIGGTNVLGISTRCVEGAADVRVAASAADAQSLRGWLEGSDCGAPVVRFDISVSGPNSIGMWFDTMATSQFAEGTVVVDGVGIVIGPAHLRNLSVTASTAIQCALSCDGTIFDNIHVPQSKTALDVEEAFFVQVTDSTFFGEILVRSDSPSNHVNLRIDSSTIGAITIEPGRSVAIGSSKVTGPIVSGPDQLTCVNVYDGNYQPISCD